MSLDLTIHRCVAPACLRGWYRKMFTILTVFFAIAGMPSVSNAEFYYSTPLVTDWTYDMGGTKIVQGLESSMAAVGCPLYATPLPWTTIGDGKKVYSGGGSVWVDLGEIQEFNIQTSSDTKCQGYLYNIRSCGGTCYGGYTQNGKSRTLYCEGNIPPAEVLIGSKWLWACLESPPKVVVIDPGHGFSCPQMKMAIGAVGATDFPANDPPPGRLREDALTVAIALELEKILPPSKYKVVLTKRDANTCLSYVKRGRIANEAKAKVFVSIHINSGNILGSIFASGTSALYNSAKPPSKGIADQIAMKVASSLGVNNRGSSVDDSLAVLKPTVTDMNAVLLEAARLSGDDEKKLHAPGAAAKVAAGIKAGLDASLGN